MTTLHFNNGSSFEVKNISLEEFRRAEYIASLNPLLDIDLIVISNGDLHFKIVNTDFLKFTYFIAQPLYEDNLKDFMTFAFIHLYLLLLIKDGTSAARKFLRGFDNLPYHTDVLDKLLYDTTCKNVEEFLRRHFKSDGRISVKLTKYAYTTLTKLFENSYATKKEMISILRVFHENFHVDICNEEVKDSTSNEEIMKELESWFEPFVNPVKKKKSKLKNKVGASKKLKNKKIPTMKMFGVEPSKMSEEDFDEENMEEMEEDEENMEDLAEDEVNLEDLAEALLSPPDFDVADLQEILDIRKMSKLKGLFSKDSESLVDKSAATTKRAKKEATYYYLLEFKKAYKTDLHITYPISVPKNYKISSSDISSDLRYMAIGFENCEICTYRLGRDNIEIKLIDVLRGHKGIISALSIDSRLQRLISGSHDHTVIIWDIEQSMCLKIFSEHSAPVSDVCVSPNSMHFLSASEDKSICLFSYDDDIYVRRVFSRHSQKAINCLQFHPNSMYFACACADGSLFLFQVNESNCPKRIFNKHKCSVYALSFSPMPKKHLASADIEGVIIIWDILTFLPIKILETGYEIRSISYDISGSFLVAMPYLKPFIVYNMEGENIDLVIVESQSIPFPGSVKFCTKNRMFIIQHVEADGMKEMKGPKLQLISGAAHKFGKEMPARVSSFDQSSK